MYLIKDCNKIKAYTEEPKEAAIWVDNKSKAVTQLEFDNTMIFEYNLYDRISFGLWFIGIALIWSILMVIYIIKAPEDYGRNW